MVRASQVLIVVGALVVVPLGMGGIPLVKLLFFALAVLIGATSLYGTGLHSLARRIRTASVCAPCGPVPHCIALCLCTFFAAVFLSLLWSAAPFLSVVGIEPRFEGVIAYVVFLGLALVAWGMVRRGCEQNLLQVILWSNVGVVSYGLLQGVGMDPLGGWWDADLFLGRAFSTVGQPNFLGQFLLLTAPFAILTTWRRRGESSLSPRERARVRGFPIIAGVVLVLNFLVLFATGSRAGIVGAIVATSFYLLSRGERTEVRGPLTLTLCTLFLVLVLAFLPLAFRRFTLPGEWDRSFHGRIAIWRDAVTMIRARPFGWGLETTGLIFPRFQSSPLTKYESLTTSVDRAHSKPLDLLLTVGSLGLLGYYGFLAMLIVRCLRMWRCHRDGLALAGVVSLLGVSISLLFGFEGMVVHAFFWLICGMLAGLPLPAPARRSFSEGGGDGRGEGLPIPRTAAYVLCIILLNVVAFFTLSLSARFTMDRAERAFQNGDLVIAVQEYGRAVLRSPWDRALLVRFLETALLARERAGDPSTREKLDAVLMKRFHRLDRLTRGQDPFLPSLQAWYAALQGKKKEALGLLDDAKIHAPFSIPRLRIAARVAQLLNDKTMENALRTELKNMLPSWWSDVRDPRRRILLKENRWVEAFSPLPSPSPQSSPAGRGRHGTLL